MKIPREKYKALAKGKHVPYRFEIKKRNQNLFYFGANHSHDPKNKQYPTLKKYWQKFLALPNSQKLLVVEGGLRRLERNEQLAIKHGSEGSFITLLAHQKHIPIISPEPSAKKILSLLRKKFSEDYIQYYNFAHYVDSWHRHKFRPDFDTWVVDVMRWYSKRLSFKGFTLERMKGIHERIFKKPFNHLDKNLFNSATSPSERKTVINNVARFSSDIRDIAVINRLQKEWKLGKSLLVVYGSGHAFIQENILKKLLR